MAVVGERTLEQWTMNERCYVFVNFWRSRWSSETHSCRSNLYIGGQWPLTGRYFQRCCYTLYMIIVWNKLNLVAVWWLLTRTYKAHFKPLQKGYNHIKSANRCIIENVTCITEFTNFKGTDIATCALHNAWIEEGIEYDGDIILSLESTFKQH